MGDILNTLISTGSLYTYNAVNGTPQVYPENFTPPISPLATKDSTLHFNPNAKKNKLGYSTIGTAMGNYNTFFQDWVSSNNNTAYLPNPSNLELTDPEGSDIKNKPKYNYIKGNRYQDQNFKID